MRRVISLLQPLRRHVRVDLRRDEMRVAEQFLHAPQIRARIQQVRRVTGASGARFFVSEKNIGDAPPGGCLNVFQ